jgi:hypothetical protein
VHDVLIPAAEQRAFAQLVAMLSDERIAFTVVDRTAASEHPASELVIPPIEITPLPNPAQQPGE